MSRTSARRQRIAREQRVRTLGHALGFFVIPMGRRDHGIDRGPWNIYHAQFTYLPGDQVPQLITTKRTLTAVEAWLRTQEAA